MVLLYLKQGSSRDKYTIGNGYVIFKTRIVTWQIHYWQWLYYI